MMMIILCTEQLAKTVIVTMVNSVMLLTLIGAFKVISGLRKHVVIWYHITV